MAAGSKPANSTHRCGNVGVSGHASVHEGDTAGHIGVATSIASRRMPGKSAGRDDPARIIRWINSIRPHHLDKS